MNELKKIKEGDAAAFSRVYSAYLSKLEGYIYAKTRSRYLAEEVAQISFEKLWKNRGAIKEDLPLEAQLFQITKTTLIDEIRKQNNLLGTLRKVAEQPPAGEYWDQIRLKEINAVFHKNLEAMPPVRREIFALSRLEGLSNKEIAYVLSVSVKTVEKHITLALRQLRKHFLFLLLVLERIFLK